MQLTSAPLIFLASLLPAFALATPTPRQSNSPVALTYSSTSPYGQSTGYIGLTQGSYGYGMTMVATDSETISAHLDGNGGIVQDCPNAGLVGALVAQADGITWNFEWVEESALGSLPAGSTTTSFTQGAPAPWSSSPLSTVGTTVSFVLVDLFDGIHIDIRASL